MLWSVDGIGIPEWMFESPSTGDGNGYGGWMRLGAGATPSSRLLATVCAELIDSGVARTLVVCGREIGGEAGHIAHTDGLAIGGQRAGPVKLHL